MSVETNLKVLFCQTVISYYIYIQNLTKEKREKKKKKNKQNKTNKKPKALTPQICKATSNEYSTVCFTSTLPVPTPYRFAVVSLSY